MPGITPKTISHRKSEKINFKVQRNCANAGKISSLVLSSVLYELQNWFLMLETISVEKILKIVAQKYAT